MKKIFLILTFSFLPLLALANNGLVPCGPGTDQPRCQPCHLFELANNIINYLLAFIIPILAPLMLVLGGIILIVAYMNPDKGPEYVKTARGIFKTVVIGLVVIYTAWIIVSLFFQVTGYITWDGFGGDRWWHIECETNGADPGAPARVCSWRMVHSCSDSPSYPVEASSAECGSQPQGSGPWSCCCNQ